MLETGAEPPHHWLRGQPPDDQEDHPVVAVFWHDALAYCKWLTEVTGMPYRLPSEFEWEKGARGPKGNIYPWGNRWDSRWCNSKQSGRDGTSPVNAYPEGAGPYGLLDMVGNVMEWTRSPYKRYSNDPSKLWEEQDISSNIWPVIRGGAYNQGASDLRCAARRGGSPYRWDYHLGFRVALPPPP